MGSEVEARNAYMNELARAAKETGMLVGGCETTTVLEYQTGEVCKCVVYAATREPEDAKLYIKLLQPAIADATMQLRLLCAEYGFDFFELVGDGIENFKRRIRDRGGQVP